MVLATEICVVIAPTQAVKLKNLQEVPGPLQMCAWQSSENGGQPTGHECCIGRGQLLSINCRSCLLPALSVFTLISKIFHESITSD
jgi:hypothetical protein